MQWHILPRHLLGINRHALGQCVDIITTQQNQGNAYSGLYGKSTVREVDALTGGVLRQQALPARDFGEGMTKFGSR